MYTVQQQPRQKLNFAHQKVIVVRNQCNVKYFTQQQQ